jgi:serine/threonine protein kinase
MDIDSSSSDEDDDDDDDGDGSSSSSSSGSSSESESDDHSTSPPLLRSRHHRTQRGNTARSTRSTTTAATATATTPLPQKVELVEGTEVALKVVTRSDASSISAFWTELDALVSLQNPEDSHVVQLLGVCFDAEYVVAVISYHRGGPLSKWWKRHRKLNRGKKVGEVAVARVLLGVGKALAFCHDSGKLHLDVKENNVVFGRGVGDVDQVVLIDFGCAVSVAETNGVVVDTGYDDYFEGGTFCCMAPEVLTIAVRALRHERLDDSSPPPCFGAKADVWSLGIMAHVLLTGRYPYGLTGERSKWCVVCVCVGMCVEHVLGVCLRLVLTIVVPFFFLLRCVGDDIEAYELLQRMKKNDKRVWDGARDRKQLTAKAQSFLSRLLTIDVDTRPSLDEAMSDPFIVDNNIGAKSGATVRVD